MKKMITMLAIGAVVTTASADLTGFLWQGGVATDQAGSAILAGTATSQTILDVNLVTFVVDNGGQLQISIADIPVAYSMDELGVAPSFLGGAFSTLPIEGTDVGIVGSTAYLVVKNGLGAIGVGDFIGLGDSGVIVDLQPGGVGTPGLTQTFNSGDVQTNIQVIPEPATLGMMGVAALGLFLARKKAHR